MKTSRKKDCQAKKVGKALEVLRLILSPELTKNHSQSV